MELGDRIRKLRKNQRFSIDQLAVAVGISSDHLYRIERNEANNPNLKLLTSLANQLDVSIDELVGLPSFGDLAVFKAVPNHTTSNEVHSLQKMHHIEIRELDVAAGGGATDFCEEIKGYLAFQRTWLAFQGLDATQCSVIEVKGQSMEPTLPDGCSILINHAQKQRRKGRIFVVRGEDGLVVKRAGRSKDGGWLLESDHPAWESTSWALDSEVIGEVRWMAKTLG